MGGGLALEAATVGGHALERAVARRGVEPRHERGVRAQRAGVAGERGEDILRHFAGHGAIAAGAAQCGSIDEIGVTGDQLAKGGLVTPVGVQAEELGVIVHRVHLS